MADAVLRSGGVAANVLSFVAWRQYGSVESVSRSSQLAVEENGAWRELGRMVSSGQAEKRSVVDALLAREAFTRGVGSRRGCFGVGRRIYELVNQGTVRLASNPSGALIAADSEGYAYRMQASSTSFTRLAVPAPCGVNDVAWEPSGRLASAGLDGVARSHDAETFETVRVLTKKQPPAWALSADEASVAVGGYGSIAVVDWRSTAQITVRLEPNACARAVAVRDTRLAVGVTAGFAYIFDLRKPNEALFAARHLETSWKASEVRALALTPAGLLTACYDGCVRLWPGEAHGRAASTDARLIADHSPSSVEALAVLDDDYCVSVDWRAVLAVSRYAPRHARARTDLDRHVGLNHSNQAGGTPAPIDEPRRCRFAKTASAFAVLCESGLRRAKPQQLAALSDPPEPIATALALAPLRPAGNLLAVAIRNSSQSHKCSQVHTLPLFPAFKPEAGVSNNNDAAP